MADKIDKTIINADHIDKVYDDVKDLYLSGKLEKEIYYKCLISLSYEYLLLSDLSNCVHLISECEGYYINNILQDQMDEDQKFKKLVLDLVDILDTAGLPLDDIESDKDAIWMTIYNKKVVV